MWKCLAWCETRNQAKPSNHSHVRSNVAPSPRTFRNWNTYNDLMERQSGGSLTTGETAYRWFLGVKPQKTLESHYSKYKWLDLVLLITCYLRFWWVCYGLLMFCLLHLCTCNHDLTCSIIFYVCSTFRWCYADPNPKPFNLESYITLGIHSPSENGNGT